MNSCLGTLVLGILFLIPGLSQNAQARTEFNKDGSFTVYFEDGSGHDTYRDCQPDRVKVKFIGTSPFCIQDVRCNVFSFRKNAIIEGSVKAETQFICLIDKKEDRCSKSPVQECMKDGALPEGTGESCMTEKPGAILPGCPTPKLAGTQNSQTSPGAR